MIILGFFVSYYFILQPDSFELVISQLEKLLLIASLAVVAIFLIELYTGHRFGFALAESSEAAYGYLEDARGVRVLNTVQTFSAGVYAIFILCSIIQKRRPPLRYLILALIMVGIMLISMNRVAIISLGFGVGVYLLFFNRSKQKLQSMAAAGLGVLIVLLAVMYLPTERFAGLDLIWETVLNPSEEATGTGAWRMAGQAAAYEAFLENPLLGQGIGGYWDWSIGGEYQRVYPHNQYLSIMTKTGTVGLVLFIIIIISVFKNYFKYREAIPAFGKPLFETVFIIALSSIPYGLGYDYVPLYGFYLGIFAGILHRSLEPNPPVMANEPAIISGEPYVIQ
jgi:O-antigen ligase